MATNKISVSKQEKKLLDLIHNMEFGELKILIQDSIPIRAEEHIKAIEL